MGNILNPDTGEIYLSENLVITPSSKADDLKRYFALNELRSLGMGNGWVNCSIKNIRIADEYFIFIFVFHNGILKTVSFIISALPFSEESWKNWSKEKEVKNKSFFENWLSTQVGSQRNFTWGNVNAGFDEKSGGAAIVVNYNG